MKTIQWGMIGTGNVTERKSGPAIYKADHSRLFGVTNRTLSKAEDYARRHSIAKVYTSIEAMIADPQIDIIYIATPPGAHKEIAIQCAKAKKPVYIEKPLALNYMEALDIIDAFEESGTKAFVAYYRRRLPRFLKVKELLEQGAIGDVRFVQVLQYRPPTEDEKEQSWRVQPEISGGGIFMDIAVHQLDILDFLFGPITSVRSMFGNQANFYKPEDIVNIVFQFENGIQGSGDWCFTAGVSDEYIEIVGSAGSIRFQCFGVGAIRVETQEGMLEYHETTPEHIQQPLIQSIVDELNGIDVCPSTLYTAARTAWVCDRVYHDR